MYHKLKIWLENETPRQEKKESIKADPKMTQSWNSDDKLGDMNIPKELEFHSVAVVVIKWVVQKQLTEGRAYYEQANIRGLKQLVILHLQPGSRKERML